MVASAWPTRAGHGFTLVELVVALAIAALLLGAAAPFLSDWSHSAQTGDARAKLASAYAAAKSLALRNPTGAALTDGSGNALPAAGLRLVVSGGGSTLFVCQGDPTSGNCAAGGSAVSWQADYPSAVSTALGGVTASSASALTLALDNRGVPASSTTYSLSRGSSANNESGTLR